jgi:hypothetical protein
MSPEVHKHGRNEMICKEIQVKNQSFPEARFPFCSQNQLLKTTLRLQGCKIISFIIKPCVCRDAK